MLLVLKVFLKKYPRLFGRLLFALLVEGGLSAVSVLSLIPLADYIIDPALLKSSQITKYIASIFNLLAVNINFWTLGGLFIFLNLIKNIADIGTRALIIKTKYEIIQGLFKEYLKCFFSARWEFFNNNDQGKLLNSLNGEMNTIGDAIGNLALCLAQCFQFIIYLAVPIFLYPKLTLTGMGLAIILSAPFLFAQKYSYRLGFVNTITANKLMLTLSELITSSRLVLSFGNQDVGIARYIKEFKEHVSVTFKSQLLGIAVIKIYQPLGMLSIILAIGIASSQGILISELAAVMWSLLAAIPILASILQGGVAVKNFLPSYHNLELLRKSALTFSEKKNGAEFKGFNEEIWLNNINFKYLNGYLSLENIEIKIKKGEMVALLGESGAGKSTIVDVILGLQAPYSGEIYIDKIPLKNYSINSYRKKIGYVPQDPQLFNCSIKENLLWANDCASDLEVLNAIRLSNSESFIKNLPDGIETIVGDRGAKLSGGQRQRIALAMALIRKPSLLILDEATSALDSESELDIQNAVEGLRSEMSIFIIAHRLSTIIRSDRLYVIHQGRNVESGTYDELKNLADSRFSKMLITQSILN